MFTPIVDEISSLLQDLILIQGVIIDEQNETANNACAFIKYEGMLSQLQQDIERVSEFSIHIGNHIEYIMKNAADGNYSAKMKITEDENILLKEKIDIMQAQIDAITNNLNKDNEAKTQPKQLEGNLEL